MPLENVPCDKSSKQVPLENVTCDKSNKLVPLGNVTCDKSSKPVPLVSHFRNFGTKLKNRCHKAAYWCQNLGWGAHGSIDSTILMDFWGFQKIFIFGYRFWASKIRLKSIHGLILKLSDVIAMYVRPLSYLMVSFCFEGVRSICTGHAETLLMNVSRKSLTRESFKLNFGHVH